MNKSLRNLVITAGIAFAVQAVAGCQGDTPDSADALAQDSTLNLEVMLANQDTSLQAQLGADTLAAAPDPIASDTEPVAVAASPSPAASQSAPSRRARSQRAPTQSRARTVRSTRTSRRARAEVQNTSRSLPARRASTTTRGTPAAVSRPAIASGSSTAVRGRFPMRGSAILPAGSELSLEASRRICTGTSSVGDEFSARLAQDIVGPLGTVIPEGSIANGEVSSLTKTKGEKHAIGLRIESITVDGTTYPVSSQVTYTQVDRVRARSRGGSAGKTAAGAGIGALLGHVVGGNTQSVVIGAAGGAVAGAVTSARSRGFDECVPDGGRITAELTRPLKVRLSE